MSDEVLTHISDEMVDAIQKFDDDYLADVFRPWDCYKQNWHDRYTTLCRFESNDYLVYEDELGLNYRIMPLDTNSVDDSIAQLIGADKDDTCLCWLRDDDFSKLIGKKKVGMEILWSLW